MDEPKEDSQPKRSADGSEKIYIDHTTRSPVPFSTRYIVEGGEDAQSVNKAEIKSMKIEAQEEPAPTTEYAPGESTADVAIAENTVVAVEEKAVAEEATAVAEEATAVAEEVTAVAEEGKAVAAEGTAVAAEEVEAATEEVEAATEAATEETASAAEETAAAAEETAAAAEETVTEEKIKSVENVESTEDKVLEVDEPASISEAQPVEDLANFQNEKTCEEDPVSAVPEASDTPTAQAEDEAVEENEEAEEEEEEEDVFAGLSVFANDVFGLLGLPAEPLSSEERAPKPLPATGQDPTNIVRLLQDLMTYDEEEPEVTYGLGALDLHGRTSSVSHLLAALVTTLDPQHLRRLATRIMSDTCMWISRLFRYSYDTVYLHRKCQNERPRAHTLLLQLRHTSYSRDLDNEGLYAAPPMLCILNASLQGAYARISMGRTTHTGRIRGLNCSHII
ncbi:unnamed protein product, partial [Meganyctiphanes norvegica]